MGYPTQGAQCLAVLSGGRHLSRQSFRRARCPPPGKAPGQSRQPPLLKQFHPSALSWNTGCHPEEPGERQYSIPIPEDISPCSTEKLSRPPDLLRPESKALPARIPAIIREYIPVSERQYSIPIPEDISPCSIEGEEHIYLRLRVSRARGAYAAFYRKRIPVLRAVRFRGGERRYLPESRETADFDETPRPVVTGVRHGQRVQHPQPACLHTEAGLLRNLPGSRSFALPRLLPHSR